MRDQLKTSVRIVGDDVDVFRAMCQLDGLRPHQLVAQVVGEAVRAGRDDPQVAKLTGILRHWREENEAADQAAAVARGHLRLVQ